MVAMVVVGQPTNLDQAKAVTHPGKAKATFAALNRCASPRSVAARRGKKVSDLLGPRRDQTVPSDSSAAEAPNA